MSTEIFQVKGEKFQKKNFMQATSRLLQLTDDPTVRKALLQIVIALEDNFHAREDLLQGRYFISGEWSDNCHGDRSGCWGRLLIATPTSQYLTTHAGLN